MPNSRRKTKRLIIAYSVTLLALALFTANGIKKYNNISQATNATDSSFTLVSHITELDNKVKELGRNERGFLLFNDSSLIAPANQTILSIEESMNILRKVYQGQPSENLVRFLHADIQQRIFYYRESIKFNMSEANDSVNRIYLMRGRVLERKISATIDSLTQRSQHELQQSRQKRVMQSAEATQFLGSLIGVAGLLVIILFIALLLEFNSRTRHQEKLARNLFQMRLSKKEMDQIAFGATHTLQEPIRKIRIHMNRAAQQNISPEERKMYLDKADQMAERLQTIIGDLGRLAEMNEVENFEILDLNDSLNNALNHLKDKYDFNKDWVQSAPLPQVNGNKRDLQLFFEEVLKNSQQAAKTDRPLQIFITSSQVLGKSIPLSTVPAHLHQELFHKISINDNGKGFDGQYADSIFAAFKKLNHSDSSGIGLALCQRIATNHSGYITASAAPEQGANISLFLPVKRIFEL